MDEPRDDDLEDLVGRLIAKSKAAPPLSQKEIVDRLRLRLVSQERAEQPAPPPPRRKIFDPSVSVGTVVTVLLALCAGATATVGWVMHLQSQSYEFQRDIAELKRNRDADNLESARLRVQWLPRIEGNERETAKLASENVVQNNRIENMVESIRDVRRSSDAIMTALNNIQIDIASIKGKLPDRRADAKVR